ncbi:MAG: sigma-70 family RNA polymerase sigma factor [bacterium]|nr:sigma-70 family RNA polymerase sigma factor [bacterium]
MSTGYVENRCQNRDALILENLGFVGRILSTMSFFINDPEVRDSLNSAGVVGLVEAANNYDPRSGTAFRTFAYPRIRGAIVDELRKSSPVSQQTLKNIGRLKKAYETLPPPVTPEALVKKTGMTLEQVEVSLEAIRFTQPDSWDDFCSIAHGSWRDAVQTPDRIVENAEMLELLTDAIEALPEQERLVLSMYFLEELNLAEIGQVLRLSESRISRVLASAKFRLQEVVRCKTK